MSDRAGLLRRIVDWLRTGYPQGVPQSDYVALLAVLHRDLTDTEIVLVAEELARGRGRTDITATDIAAAIGDLAKEKAGPDDIARVAAHLAATGRSLAPPLAAPERKSAGAACEGAAAPAVAPDDQGS
ncbi:DUF3349 domain-containing protein [Nocardia asteroides]|uniref:DUF3349 domain-containing protein n=1 Tax=Nocardia asteroides TaxID=1824 RepID=UPI001E4DD66A|nr:DUF3349 domain-containing protein [Nocardia asteroides]UGT64722.1 DUF3349 domain-containing protein [Nocardia asteroides]